VARKLYRRSDYARALRLPTSRESPAWRSEFRRDYGRLIHSPSFRRLQGKTQLFPGAESEYFRNRLTHSLEVAQIAKTIAAKLSSELPPELQIDGDLVEIAGLAHDLGHPPFGHTGEAVLDRLMRSRGGFEGNAQTLRILARVEKKLDDPDQQLDPENAEPVWYRLDRGETSVGLNLCARTLASILKYDAEIPQQRRTPKLRKGYYRTEAELVDSLRTNVSRNPVGPGAFKTVECQIMDLADDIAYSTYDIEDAFKSGLLTPLDLLFAPREITELVAAGCSAALECRFESADVTRVLRELMPQVVKPVDPDSTFTENLGRSFQESRSIARRGMFRSALTSALVNRAVQAVTIEVDSANPALSRVSMDPGIRAGVEVLKHMVYEHLIASEKMKLVARRAERIIETIFEELESDSGSGLLPPDWASRFQQAEGGHQKRVICDFIAGMTDRHAVDLYDRLTSSNYRTIFQLP
jgi:dGTPase